jgi:hypothetical protein
MSIDTMSLRCPRNAQSRIARTLMSDSRNYFHTHRPPRKVPNSYESMRRQTNETGQRLFAALTNTLKPPKYGNCLIFAIRLWLIGGGYLIVRKSRAGWFPHFLWCADLADTKVLHFTPRKVAPWWYRPIHMLWFSSVIKCDDL